MKAAMLSVLIQEFENRFQDRCFFFNFFLYICNSFFIQHKYIFQIECIELSSDIQLRNLIVSFYQNFIREKYPLLHSRTLFMSLLLAVHTFVSNCCQGWRTGRVKLHKNSWRIATTATEPDWCISFTKTRSNIPLALCFCCFLSSLKKSL